MSWCSKWASSLWGPRSQLTHHFTIATMGSNAQPLLQLAFTFNDHRSAHEERPHTRLRDAWARMRVPIHAAREKPPCKTA